MSIYRFYKLLITLLTISALVSCNNRNESADLFSQAIIDALHSFDTESNQRTTRFKGELYILNHLSNKILCNHQKTLPESIPLDYCLPKNSLINISPSTFQWIEKDLLEGDLFQKSITIVSTYDKNIRYKGMYIELGYPLYLDQDKYLISLNKDGNQYILKYKKSNEGFHLQKVKQVVII